MKTMLMSLTLCASIAAGATVSAPLAQAKPGGCLKYGAAGAVAGHVAGGHAVKGAILGCAAGMYARHRYKVQQKELQNQGGQKL
jgi:hypothetical protein